VLGALGTFNHAFWTIAYLRLRALAEGSLAPPGGMPGAPGPTGSSPQPAG
jgi:hypothetical protein